MKSGYLTITNIRLANRIHPNGINKEKKIVSAYKLESSPRNQSRIKNPINPNKNQLQAIERNNKNNTKMNESFNNHFVPRENFDELFIRPQSNSEAFMNDTDNSLIPTIDDLPSLYLSGTTLLKKSFTFSGISSAVQNSGKKPFFVNVFKK